jgi:hypothetical protein
MEEITALYRELEAWSYLRDGIYAFVDFGLISQRAGFDCLADMQTMITQGWSELIDEHRTAVEALLAQHGHRFS